MSSSPRYMGYFSPDYPVQLTDDSGKAINLTGVDVNAGFTLIMQNTNTMQFQYGIGAWTITDATNGKASYQWTDGDLFWPGTFLVFVTVQLPGEPSPRAFDPDTVVVVALTKGNAAVATQDVNLLEVNGAQVSSANPVPVAGPMTTADGGNVTLGAKADAAVTDPTVSASEIALLKGLVKILALQGVAITGVSGALADGAIATLGTTADAAWSGTGSGTAIAILKKLEALLAATLAISGSVGVSNFPSIQRVDAQSGDFPAGAIADLATLLALAGTSGDADTVASLMGRLTKIRDLLEGTIGVSGSVSVNTISNYAAESGGNLAGIKADTDSILTHDANIDTATAAIETHAASIDTTIASIKTDSDTLVTNTTGLATQTTLASVKTDLDTLASIVSSNKANTQDIEASGYIALTSPPSTTNAGSDTPLTFSSQVNRVIIQNNTNANVNFDFDQAASAGSFLIGPGGLIVYPKKCTAFHLFTAAAQNINGSASGNIIVRGAL